MSMPNMRDKYNNGPVGSTANDAATAVFPAIPADAAQEPWALNRPPSRAARPREQLNGVPNAAHTGVPNGVPNGVHTGVPSGVPNGFPQGNVAEPAPAPAPAPPRRDTDAIGIEVAGGRQEKAQRGWRARLNNMGLSLQKGPDEVVYDARIAEIRRTPRLSQRVGVVSGKGGSGKTVTSLALGMTIARHNAGIQVSAISIDPMGNINHRVKPATGRGSLSSVSTFAEDPELRDFNAVISHMVATHEGLRVLGSSGADSRHNHVLTGEELKRALQVLAGYFSVTMVDFGLDFGSDTYHAAMSSLDALVFTAGMTVDSVQMIIDHVQTLKELGGFYVDLVQRSVVVLVQTRTGRQHIAVESARQLIEDRLGLQTVIAVPFDEHIAEGGPIALDLLDEETRLSYVNAAAEVMRKLA